MSSVRGQPAAAARRGRGNTTVTNRGRASSRSRGRVYSTPSQRANAIPPSGGAPSVFQAQTSTRGARASTRAAQNGFTRRRSSTQGAPGRAKSTGSWQDRYQALTTAREHERADAIQRGLMADPSKPTSLSEAITPTGTCQDMCAEYERVQRVVQKDVWKEERDPTHSAHALSEDEPDEARMVKKFRRAAAGLEEQLPSDLRPPAVLKRTCDYLFNDVIGNAESLGKVHHFVWDRTRAVRNDFSIQQVSRSEELRIAIDCYERIARFHIVSLHQLALPEKPYSKYDWQQEREQLDRTLLSLMQYYDDSHGRFSNQNEAEFRAYCVIFQLQDPIPDLEDRTQTWPHSILKDRRVQKALDLYMAACNVLDPQGPLKPRASHLIARQDWQRFWVLVASKEVSYLMACVAEIYFNLVRRTVLAALFKTSRANSSLATPDWTIDVLGEMLAFDNGDQIYDYCEKFGFSFNEREDGEPYLDLTSVKGRSLPEPAAGIPKQSKTELVEDKRFGRTLPAVINGLSVQQARNAGLVVEEEANNDMDAQMEDGSGLVDGEDTMRLSQHAGKEEEEESLFIPEVTSSAAASAPTSQPSIFAQTNATPSPFAKPTSPFSGADGLSTFGRPSTSANTDGASDLLQLGTQPRQASSTGVKFNFLQPAASPSTTKTTAPPVFDFTSVFKSSEPTQGTPTTTEPQQQSTQTLGGIIPATTVPPAQAPAPLFQFPKPNEQTKAPSPERPTFEQPKAPFQFASVSSAEPSPSTFTFGPSAMAPAPEPVAPSFQSQPLEVKAPQPQSFPPPASTSLSPPSPPSSTPPVGHHTGLPAISAGVRRPSSSGDNRPKKPSPLSNSITAADDAIAVADLQAETATATSDFETNVERVATEFFDTPVAGVLDQYVRFHVSHTIRDVKEAIEREGDTATADEFRERRLSMRFGRLWRTLFWQQKSAKAGRERRQRRQRRLQERSSVETELTSAIDRDSVSSAGESLHRGGIETYQTDIDMGSVWSMPAIASVEGMKSSKRPISSHGREAVNSNRMASHKRLKSTGHVDERGRIAKPAISRPAPTSHPQSDLVKRSAFLAFSTAPGSQGIMNTTSTPYFRLKAMGIDQLDKSLHQRGIKRRLAGSQQSSAETSPPAFRTPSVRTPSVEHKQQNTSMPPPASTTSRSSRAPEEDESLFARLRAAREGLTQSTAYYKTEVTRDDELRRSLNASQSSNDFESPSMAKARAAAKGDALESDVPAYRLRESKFVPREKYGLAIERSKQFRESRSREQSRPESRIDLEPSTLNLDQLHPQSTAFAARTDQGPAHGRAAEANGFTNVKSLQPRSMQSAQQPREEAQIYAPQPISFAHHTTQLTNGNPFLQDATSKDIHPTYPAATKDWSTPHTINHTIQSSQINQALANSFGEAHGHGQNHMYSLSANGFVPNNHDSHLSSQPISLLSDDEDDDGTPANPPQSGFQRKQERGDSQLEHARLDYMSHPNPYAALAHNGDTDEEDAVSKGDQDDEGDFEETDIDLEVESGNEESDIDAIADQADEDNEQHSGEDDYDGVYQYDDPGNGYGYQTIDQYSDMNAVDGDIDEDETRYPSEEEDDEQSDYAERDDLGSTPSLPSAGEPCQAAGPCEQGNAELQAVGNTEDDAIELSD